MLIIATILLRNATPFATPVPVLFCFSNLSSVPICGNVSRLLAVDQRPGSVQFSFEMVKNRQSNKSSNTSSNELCKRGLSRAKRDNLNRKVDELLQSKTTPFKLFQILI